MNEEQASVEYYRAKDSLQEVISSGYRGDKDEVLGELEEDLE